ncbi:ankyrin repeat domain-containing protein [Chloropicon primus]|nr:ankyrin repeat domain-containing protein [Chloropicon primus]
MSFLGSIENCRIAEYTGPLQINLKLTPIPGVWKDDPQYLEFVQKIDHKEKLKDDFTALFESDRSANFADVKFIVEGKDVFAHKAILAARAESFKKGFVSEWKSESREGEMSCYKVFKGIRCEVFVALIRYLYTSQADFSLPQRYIEDDVPISKRGDESEILDCALQFGIDILQAAESYSVGGLRYQAVQFLAGFTLYPSKIFMILVVAHRHGLKTLKTYCLQMLAKHDAISILELLSRVDMPFNVLSEVNKIRSSYGLLSAESVKCQKLMEENKQEELLSFIDRQKIDLDKSIILHLMSGFGTPSGIKDILERGANINHYDDDGNTPLHYATISANPDNVSQLLKSGANPFLKNCRQRMPLDELEYVRTLGSETSNTEENLQDRQAACEQLISSHASQVLKPVNTEEFKPRDTASRASEIVLNPDFVHAINPDRKEAITFAPAVSHGGFFPYRDGVSMEQELMQFMLPNTCMTLLRVDEAQNNDNSKGKDGKSRKTFPQYLEEHNITDNLLSDLLQSGS